MVLPTPRTTNTSPITKSLQGRFGSRNPTSLSWPTTRANASARRGLHHRLGGNDQSLQPADVVAEQSDVILEHGDAQAGGLALETEAAVHKFCAGDPAVGPPNESPKEQLNVVRVYTKTCQVGRSLRLFGVGEDLLEIVLVDVAVPVLVDALEDAAHGREETLPALQLLLDDKLLHGLRLQRCTLHKNSCDEVHDRHACKYLKGEEYEEICSAEGLQGFIDVSPVLAA
mmetsp:Transcript_4443/g.10193  ORF Transcript_4443/g.10193 Transcript_4443/m.10193 type:complete len:228 (+) Transcript_4443:3-686(+)